MINYHTYTAQGSSLDHYRYYISNIDKEIKRTYIAKNCIVPAWRQYIKGKRVLEIGGGPGYFAKFIKDDCFFVNTDTSFAFLKEAKEREMILLNTQASALFLPFKNNSFDTVIISGLFVYLDDSAAERMLCEIKKILPSHGHILIHEPLEYVRWYKVYLRLLHLDCLEISVGKLYTTIARLRGLQKETQEIHTTDLRLYIRNQEAYTALFKQTDLTCIMIRPTFVNIAPPSLEKYFFRFSYLFAPFLTSLRKTVNNGLLIVLAFEKEENINTS